MKCNSKNVGLSYGVAMRNTADGLDLKGMGSYKYGFHMRLIIIKHLNGIVRSHWRYDSEFCREP